MLDTARAGGRSPGPHSSRDRIGGPLRADTRRRVGGPLPFLLRRSRPRSLHSPVPGGTAPGWSLGRGVVVSAADLRRRPSPQRSQQPTPLQEIACAVQALAGRLQVALPPFEQFPRRGNQLFVSNRLVIELLVTLETGVDVPSEQPRDAIHVSFRRYPFAVVRRALGTQMLPTGQR